MWTFALLLPLLQPAIARDCFYPNGKSSADGVPCGEGDAMMCCPDKWQCLDNGLCHYEPDNTWGRYSCTDKSWGDSCPQICNREESEVGNEAVLQCFDGTWCCDENHPERLGGKSCCEAGDGSVFFNFGDPKVFASIAGSSAVQTSGSAPTSAAASSSTLSSKVISTSSSSTRFSLSVTVGTPLSTLSTGVSASASTFSSSMPSANLSTNPSPSGSNGRTVGISVGVPIATIAICVLGWIFYKEIKQPRHTRGEATPFDFDRDEGPSEKLGPDNGHPASASNNRLSTIASEIDSREVRIPIGPQDAAHPSPNTNFIRDETTNTLYPHARPNYTNFRSPPPPQSPTSTTISNLSDYAEWSVTPHLQQHRWSGTTAQDGGVGASMGYAGGLDVSSRDDGHGGQHLQETTGRPRIPSTIAELP